MSWISLLICAIIAAVIVVKSKMPNWYIIPGTFIVLIIGGICIFLFKAAWAVTMALLPIAIIIGIVYFIAKSMNKSSSS